jgi:hypothetical protein
MQNKSLQQQLTITKIEWIAVTTLACAAVLAEVYILDPSLIINILTF